MRENDIVFLNLHRKYLNIKPQYGGFIGIYSLAAFVNDNGYSGQAYAGTLHQGKEIVDEICSQGLVSVIGLYCDYANVTENEYISQYIKQKYHLPVVVGGPQATSLGKEFLLKSGSDALIRYEGELTVVELLDYFLDGTGELANIKGIAYLQNGQLQINSERPLITNLDALPFIDDECYLKPTRKRSELSIITGRGCPFHCAFCHEGSHTKQVRWRSVDNVLAEIDAFMDAHPHLHDFYLLFVDDTFTLNEKRLQALCQGLKERRQKRMFHWFCEGHVHTLAKHPRMIQMLADAGAQRLQLGIESGNAEVLDAYHKNTTPEEIKSVVAACRDAGIQQVYGNIILGSAFFSQETYEKDLAFGKELQKLGAGTLELGVVSYWPLPETEITNHPKKFDMKIHDTAFYTSADDFPQTSTEEFSQLQILQAVQNMNHAFEKQRQEMLCNGEVPFSRILSWFEDGSIFHIYGMWFRSLQKVLHVFNCAQLVYEKEAIHLLSESAEPSQMHPMRTLPLSDYLCINDDQTALIEGVRLSERDLSVLVFATGRLSNDEIYKNLQKKYRNFSWDTYLEVLHKLEKAYLIVYAEE